MKWILCYGCIWFVVAVMVTVAYLFGNDMPADTYANLVALSGALVLAGGLIHGFGYLVLHTKPKSEGYRRKPQHSVSDTWKTPLSANGAVKPRKKPLPSNGKPTLMH